MATGAALRISDDYSPRTQAKNIRILIADECRLNCQLLETALAPPRFPFCVVASTICKEEMLQRLSAGSVDIVLLNEVLKEGVEDGLGVLSDIRANCPEARVVAILKFASPQKVVDVFRRGAKGIFCRAEPVEALVKCILAVHGGQIWINTEQLHIVMEALVKASPMRVVDVKGRNLLAKRETEVALLISEGLNNREVARHLGLSEHTVSNYLFRIYEKLGISTRVELVLYTVRCFQQRGKCMTSE